MNLASHLATAGLLQLGLAASHFWLPKRFGWKEELEKLSLLNRQIFIVHCLFIVLILLLFGGLSLFFGGLLLQSEPLARVVLGGLVVFWGVRLYAQWFIYDNALWRGRTFETAIQVIVTMVWSYLVLVYGWALYRQLS